jgi:hypothetical protein
LDLPDKHTIYFAENSCRYGYITQIFFLYAKKLRMYPKKGKGVDILIQEARLRRKNPIYKQSPRQKDVSRAWLSLLREMMVFYHRWRGFIFSVTPSPS